jgi:hypothetical protein
MMEALSSFQMSVLTRASQRNIPEDGILETSLMADITFALPEVLRKHAHVNPANL